MSFAADQAALVLTDPGLVVVPIVAVHGAQVPWGRVVMDGVPVVPARRLPSMLRELPAVLGPERVAVLAGQAPVPLPTPPPNLHASRPGDGETELLIVPAQRILIRRRRYGRLRLWRRSVLLVEAACLGVVTEAGVDLAADRSPTGWDGLWQGQQT